MRIVAKCVTAALVTAIALGSARNLAYTEWDSLSAENSTHQFLFNQIPIILASDGNQGVADFIGGQYLMNMKLGSIRADETLWDSREHYMDPQTHEGLVGFKSAGELGKEKFNAAVSYWNAGNRMESFFNLGWSIHLVQDLTVPHHAALTPFDYHSEYEQWVFDHRSDYAVSSDGIYVFESYLPGHYESESDPFDWIDYNAHHSMQFFEDVNGPNGQNGNDYAHAAAKLLPRAQRTSAGFLTMFLKEVNTPPFADAGGDRIAEELEPISFDASESEDDMMIVNWTWDFGDGSLGFGRKVVYPYPTQGSYEVSLTVRDILGEEDTVWASVLVLDATAPVAIAGEDRYVVAGEDVQLSASGSSDNIAIVNLTWTCNQAVIGYGETLDHVFATPGIYYMTLLARDSAGNYGLDEFVVVAADVNPPEAVVDTKVTLTVGESWTFSASMCTDDFGIGNLTWYFGDGQHSWGEQVNHSYDSEGVYIVTLVVEDLFGNSDKARIVVIVAIPNVGQPDTNWAFAPIVLLVLAIAGVLVVVLWVWRKIRDARSP
ncbi:MAG: PKD domain-containing protein [Thermoplasmata archaeon]